MDKRIPLELKVIETWQIKTEVSVTQGQEAKMGNFTGLYLPMNTKISVFFRYFFQMVSGAYIMGKPGHLGSKKATSVI